MTSVPPEQPRQAVELHAQSLDVATEVRCVRSVDLFRGDREIQIEHAGDTYRLRITKSRKLILYK